MIHRNLHFRCSLTIVLLFALMSSMSVIAQASLILPPMQDLVLEAVDLSSSTESDVDTSDTRMPAENPLASPSHESEEFLLAIFSTRMANTNSGSSSSSSSVSGGASSLLLCLAAESFMAEDDLLVDRLDQELQIFLPDSPSNELFHPPRKWS